MPRNGKPSTMKSILQLSAVALLPLALSHCASHRMIPFPETPNNPDLATVNTSDVTKLFFLAICGKPCHKTQSQHLSFQMPSDAASSYVYIKNHTLYIRSDHHGMPRHYNLTIGKHLNLLSTHGNVSSLLITLKHMS